MVEERHESESRKAIYLIKHAHDVLCRRNNVIHIKLNLGLSEITVGAAFYVEQNAGHLICISDVFLAVALNVCKSEVGNSGRHRHKGCLV